MKEIFEMFLSAGLSGSVIILVILALRLVLGKVPKRYICLLWLLAGLRLLVPFSLESPFSLQPDPNDLLPPAPTHSVTQPESPGTPAVGEDVQLPQVDVNNDAVSRPDMTVIDTAATAANVWAAVAGGFLVYMAVSYLLLKRRVRSAVAVDENIYECGGIDSPFVLGYLRPRIYLPAELPLEDIDHILAHERCHIRRGDHWTKLLGFVCLAVHWYNPLVWVAYGLLCRDMEMACDEDVVAALDADGRKAYSGALLRCAAGSRMGAVCPVAFGEVSVKQRIPKVLNYRKPTFWLGVVAGAVVAVVAVCFLTDPVPLTQEAKYIAQCREAFEAWQDMEKRHLLSTTRYAGEMVEDLPFSAEFWRDGDRYFKIKNYHRTPSTLQIMYLALDGKLLYREYTAAGEYYGFSDSGWAESKEWDHVLYTWVDTFEWDAHSVEFADYQEKEEKTVITLSVTEDPNRYSGIHIYQKNPYTVEFTFAADGSLEKIVRSFWYDVKVAWGMGETTDTVEWTIETYKLVPDDPEQITKEVAKCYADAEAAMKTPSK